MNNTYSIMFFRTATARGKAEQADMAADHAREDSDIAQATAKQFAPDFKQPGLDRLKPREPFRAKPVPEEQAMPLKSILHQQNDISNQNQIPNQVPTHNPTHLSQKPNQNYKKVENYPQTTIANQYQNAPTNYQSMNQLPVNKQVEIPQQNYQPQQTNHQVELQLPPKPSNEIPNRIPSEPPNPPSNPNPNPNSNPIRRNSKMIQGDRPSLAGSQQSSIDHFDHYKRPPSRDSSVDRYAKATGRLGMGSRQPSVDKTSIEADVRSVRAPSAVRGTTPMPTGNGSVITGSGANR